MMSIPTMQPVEHGEIRMASNVRFEKRNDCWFSMDGEWMLSPCVPFTIGNRGPWFIMPRLEAEWAESMLMEQTDKMQNKWHVADSLVIAMCRVDEVYAEYERERRQALLVLDSLAEQRHQ